MSVTVTIGTQTFQIPQNGEAGSVWGEDFSAAIVALADALNTSSSGYDIPPTTATISNNISTDTSVAGLSFSSTLVKSAIIKYYITRTVRETGQMFAFYNGTTWQLVVEPESSTSGVSFNINGSGQVTYQSSSDIAGTIDFSASVIEV